jgi:hypothetical protein
MDASTLSHPGFIGGMFGALVGIIGGSIGFYRSWKKAKSSKEKQYMIGFTLVIVVVSAGFIALQLLGGTVAKTIGWICYGILYPALIVFGAKRLNQLYSNEESPSDAST